MSGYLHNLGMEENKEEGVREWNLEGWSKKKGGGGFAAMLTELHPHREPCSLEGRSNVMKTGEGSWGTQILC